MEIVSPSPLIPDVVFDNLRSRSTSLRNGRWVVSSSFNSTTLGLIGPRGAVTKVTKPPITDKSFSETAGDVTVGIYH